MNKLQRSWILFKVSVSVVFLNKKLLVFPIVSFVLTMAILLCVITPVAFLKTGYSLGQFEHWKGVGQTLFAAKSVATEGGGHTTTVTLKPTAVAIGAGI